MEIQSLDALITRRGADEADALRTAAKDEAARILAAAMQRVEERRNTQRVSRATTLDAASAAERAAARHAARVAVSEARARCLDRIFAAAHARLPAVVSTPAGAARLEADLHEALDYLPPGAATVFTAPAAADVAHRTVAAQRPGTRVDIDRALETGTRVASDDGRMVIEVSLESRLDAMRRSLAIALARMLITGAPDVE